MKDNQIAELVNQLKDVAVQYADSQQLRGQIAKLVVAAVKSGPTEVTLPLTPEPSIFAPEDGEFVYSLKDLQRYARQAIELNR
jgi:hypothetical protein